MSELYKAIEERFLFINITNEQISGKMPVILICLLTNHYSYRVCETPFAFSYLQLAVNSSVTEEVNLISSLTKQKKT